MKKTAKRKAPKPKKCRRPGCETTFAPRSSFQKACSPDCSLALVRLETERKEKRDAKKLRQQHRRELRAHREARKTIDDLTKEAQREFNRYVRARDRADQQPCISCGRPESVIESDGLAFGGSWDAGHYLTVGAHPELRFDEDNVHRQCKGCNRMNGTTRKKHRAGLVKRIGEARVRRLEQPHPAPRYRHDDLRAIRDRYRARANAAEKLRPRD
jgi:hypothetical protein